MGDEQSQDGAISTAGTVGDCGGTSATMAMPTFSSFNKFRPYGGVVYSLDADMSLTGNNNKSQQPSTSSSNSHLAYADGLLDKQLVEKIREMRRNSALGILLDSKHSLREEVKNYSGKTMMLIKDPKKVVF